MSLQTRLAALITAIGADIKAIQTDSRWTNSRTPTGAAGGDLGSTYPNPTVVKSAGNFTVNGTLYPNGDIQTDGAVAVDLATQAWENSPNLSSPRLWLPNGIGPALKTRFVKNVNRDINHRRLSVCWLNSETVNWQYGTGLEIITRTDYYTGGGLTRCLIGGGYSVAPFLRVIESHGKYPFVPKLGTVYPVNLVPNPSYETDLSGWSNGNTPYETAIRQTSWSTHGSASVRLTKSVAYTAGQQSDFTTPYMSLTSLGLAVGDTVGIGAEVNVYSATGTPYVQARVGFYDASNAYLGSAVASVAPGGVAVTLGTRRVTGSAVIPANCTQIAVSLLAGSGSGTIDIAYDSIIVAKGGVPSTFLNTTVKEVEIYYDIQQYMGITAEIRYGGYTEVSRPFTSTSQIAWTGVETILGSAPTWYTGRVDITNGLEFGLGDDSASDVNLYRSAVGVLSIDGSLSVANLINLSNPVNAQDAATKAYTDSHDMPAGGTTGQVLNKKSNTNYDTQWSNPTGGAGLPEVYVGDNAPTRNAELIWIDTDEAGPATLNVTMDTWHLVGAAGEPVFQNSWVNYPPGGTYQPAGFRKFPDGKVKLKGMIYGGTAASVSFTLPVGYRPPKEVLTNAYSSAQATRVDVLPDGTVFMSGGGASVWVSLDNIEFDTESVLQTVSAAAQPMDTWHVVGAAGEPAFGSGYSSFGGSNPSIAFRKYPDGRVRIRGVVAGTASGTIFTLPVGYRPSGYVRFVCQDLSGGTTFVQCYVAADGSVVKLGSSGQVDLSAIEFDTESVISYPTAVINTPPTVTSLPASPADGQEVYYLADATNGVQWHLRYRAGSSSAYKWEFLGGSPLESYSASNAQTTGAGSLWSSQLSDGTGIIQVALPLAGDYLAEWNGMTGRSGAGTSQPGVGVWRPNAGEPNTPSGGYIVVSSSGNGSVYDVSGRSKLVGCTVGMASMVYLYTALIEIFYQRRLTITPVRVG